MTRAPRKVDPGYLKRVALWYLERWEGSRDSVRRTLIKRVDRAVQAHGQDRGELVAQVEVVLDDLVREGFLDDRRFAESTVRRLRERGSSTRRIQAALAAKGVARSLTDALLRPPEHAEGPPPERLSAIRYARRRRFGPWRRPGAPVAPDQLRKELASMARAGFDLDVAAAVLRAEDASLLEDELPIGW